MVNENSPLLDDDSSNININNNIPQRILSLFPFMNSFSNSVSPGNPSLYQDNQSFDEEAPLQPQHMIQQQQSSHDDLATINNINDDGEPINLGDQDASYLSQRNNTENEREQQSQQGSTNSDESNQDDVLVNNVDTDNEGSGQNPPYTDFLTRTRQRLRCLFILFTFPIIPLALILLIFLFWLLYAAFFGDDGANCDEPLRTYAIMSTCLFLYTPFHRKLKRTLTERRRRQRIGSSNGDREYSRFYDHLYLTFCLLYIYLGVTWTQNCHTDYSLCQAGEDINDGPGQNMADGGGGDGQDIDNASTQIQGYLSECTECGCPNLYHATRSFVLTLCVLSIVLSLPLLCLPCVYVWIIRGATEDALEAATRHSEEGHTDSLSRWSVGEVLEQMEKVYLPSEEKAPSVQKDESEDMSDKPVAYTNNNEYDALYPKECCICMNDFKYPTKEMVDEGTLGENDIIVRTKCGHVFHKSCLGGWLGLNYRDGSGNINTNLSGDTTTEGNSDSDNGSFNNRALARKRVCPLCRENLIPEDSPPNNNSNSGREQNNNSRTGRRSGIQRRQMWRVRPMRSQRHSVEQSRNNDNEVGVIIDGNAVNRPTNGTNTATSSQEQVNTF